MTQRRMALATWQGVVAALVAGLWAFVLGVIGWLLHLIEVPPTWASVWAWMILPGLITGLVVLGGFIGVAWRRQRRVTPGAECET